MKKEICVLFFLWLFVSLFFAECEPGYEETALVQVLDGKIRAIENATVQIVYQVDKSTGKGYTITPPKKTDAKGYVTFLFKNQEFLKERVDCSYSVIVTYDNKKTEKRFTVNEHGPVLQVQLEVYRFNVLATDQHGNVLPGAVIFTRTVEKITDNNGKAILFLGTGETNLTLKYGDGIVSRTVIISNDTDYHYQVGVYELKLWVVDSKNTPLVVNVSISGRTLQTDQNGELTIKKLMNARPKLTTLYLGMEKTVDVDLALQETYYVIYDLHAPIIKSIVAKEENGNIVLNMNVIDEDARASGLASDGIKVKYSLDKVDFYAPVYTKAKDEYEASIGNINKDAMIEFSIEAKDVEGNLRTVSGYFSIAFESPTTPNKINDTNNTQGFPLDPIQILGIGVIIILVLIAASYIRKKIVSS